MPIHSVITERAYRFFINHACLFTFNTINAYMPTFTLIRYMSICVEIVVFFALSIALTTASALFGAQALRLYAKRKNAKSGNKGGVEA